MIGILGNLTFIASSEKIQTFKDFSISSSVKYGKHDTLQGKPKLEYAGRELDDIKLKFFWRVEDKVNPKEEIKPLLKSMEEGEVLPFLIGGEKVGSGKYVITNIEQNNKRIDNKGNILAVEFDISLQEYSLDEVEEINDNVKKEQVKKIAVASIPLAATALSSPILVNKQFKNTAITTGITLKNLLKTPFQNKK